MNDNTLHADRWAGTCIGTWQLPKEREAAQDQELQMHTTSFCSAYCASASTPLRDGAGCLPTDYLALQVILKLMLIAHNSTAVILVLVISFNLIH